MKQRARNRHTEAGLTLVELIIAMTLLLLLTSTAYSGLMQLLRASKGLENERDTAMIANAILNRVTREIQLATNNATLLPPPGQSGTTYNRGVSLIGTPKNIRDGRSGDIITFAAKEAGQYVPDGQTHTGVVQISYRVEPVPPDENPDDEDIYYLIRDEIPLIEPKDKAYSLRMTFPITKRLVELKFRYYDKEDQQWTNDWDDSNTQLPSIVDFTVKVRGPNGKINVYNSAIALNLF